MTLLSMPAESKGIVTFCRGIDELLGSGIPREEVTEVVGVPGVGKTQLCMQAAVNTTLPVALGGVDGQTIYIDTEGSFSASRCAQIARALHRHAKDIAHKRGTASTIAHAAAMTPDRQLARIHVLRCTSLGEQIAAILALPQLVTRLNSTPLPAAAPATSPSPSSSPSSASLAAARVCKPVRLVVVDSVAFHYRGDSASADAGARARQLSAQAQALHALAAEHKLAVIVVNHMTTKLSSALGDAPAEVAMGGAAMTAEAMGDASTASFVVRSAAAAAASGAWPSAVTVSGSRLAPALGESWAHACTNRLLLFWSSRLRVARLAKSASRPLGSTAFSITEDGIRRPPVDDDTGY